MAGWRIGLLGVLVAIAGWPSGGWAEQVLTVVDDRPQEVAVSRQGITVFRFPVPVGKVLSSLTKLAIEVEGSHVVIGNVEQPGDLVALTADGRLAYTFRLRPVEVSAETVRIQEAREESRPAPFEDSIVRRAPSFVEQLVELTKWFGSERVPKGYVAESEETARAMVPEWVGLAVESASAYRGPAYTVVQMKLRNTSDQMHTIQNWEWNGNGVLGVALNRDTVPPGQSATVLIIRASQRRSDAASASAVQEGESANGS